MQFSSTYFDFFSQIKSRSPFLHPALLTGGSGFSPADQQAGTSPHCLAGREDHADALG